MLFRPSRLRFIIVRSCIVSVIIIVFLQVLPYFNADDTPPKDTNRILTFELKLREKFSREDTGLSDDERVERIKSVNTRLDKEEVNWTRVFLESYKKKSVVLSARDSKTVYKSRFNEVLQGLPQQTIEIFEETKVSDILL